MARKLGMDLERVLALSTQLTAQLGSLDDVAAEVNAAAWASLNPVSYAVQPGGLVIAPWSIAGTQFAALLVRNARHDAAVLAGRLIAEVLEQQLASAPDGATAFRDASLVQSLYRAILVSPDALTTMTPEQRAAWWSALSASERDRLITAHPLLIGNAEGLPYTDRDTANRRALDAMLADENVTGSQRDALHAVRDAIDFAEDSGEVVQLVTLDFPDGADPRAAIAFGNLDTADTIGVVVPGMDNTVEKNMTSLTAASLNLYERQKELAARVDGDSAPAVIAWMGYQTPGALPNLAVLGEERAQDGAVYLNSALGGIDVARGDEPRVTVFAHSYGSRVATYALSTGGGADALVMFGSPGVAEPVNSATDLNVPSGQVFATLATDDGVAPSGLFGSQNPDPFDPSFGAERFSSEQYGTLEGVDDHGLLLNTTSSGEKQGYMDRGTQSLETMAIVGLGR